MQMIRATLLVFAVAFPLGACASAAPDGVSVEFTTAGDHDIQLKLVHVADAQHFCAVGGAPWAHVVVNGQELEVPPGPPIYGVRFLGPDSLQPHFNLSMTPYVIATASLNTVAGDSIEIGEGGHNWRGDGGTAPFTINVSFAPDGLSGKFTAHGLHEVPAPGAAQSSATLDVTGSWTCPPPNPPAGTAQPH